MKRPALFLLLVLIATHVSGLNLEPLSREFSPDGRGRQQTFRVHNNQSDEIAVRLRMFSRGLEIDGSERREDINDEFTVFPQQMVLAPGQTQVIRVQWNGETSVERERAFRLLVEQVPVEDRRGEVDEGRDGLSLSFMYRYLASVYVTPSSAAPNVTLAEHSLGPQGTRGMDGIDAELSGVRVSGSDDRDSDVRPLALDFRNAGGRHMIVNSATVTLEYERQNGSREALEFANEQLDVLFRRNLLAGASVRQYVPVHADIDMDSLNVTYEVRQ